MNKIKGATIIDNERCKGCGLCVAACAFNTLSLTVREVNKKGYAFAKATQADNCTGCAACAIVCPDGCITVYKKKEI